MIKCATAYDCPKCKELKLIPLRFIVEPTEAQWIKMLPKLKETYPCEECQ